MKQQNKNNNKGLECLLAGTLVDAGVERFVSPVETDVVEMVVKVDKLFLGSSL